MAETTPKKFQMGTFIILSIFSWRRVNRQHRKTKINFIFSFDLTGLNCVQQPILLLDGKGSAIENRSKPLIGQR